MIRCFRFGQTIPIPFEDKKWARINFPAFEAFFNTRESKINTPMRQAEANLLLCTCLACKLLNSDRLCTYCQICMVITYPLILQSHPVFYQKYYYEEMLQALCWDSFHHSASHFSGVSVFGQKVLYGAVLPVHNSSLEDYKYSENKIYITVTIYKKQFYQFKLWSFISFINSINTMSCVVEIILIFLTNQYFGFINQYTFFYGN